MSRLMRTREAGTHLPPSAASKCGNVDWVNKGSVGTPAGSRERRPCGLSRPSPGHSHYLSLSPQVPGICRTYFFDLRPKEVGGEERATKPRIESLKDAGLPLICLALWGWSLFLHFTNNVKYQLKIAMHAFHLSFIALTDSIRLQKRTFFFLVLAYSDDL